MDFFGGYVLYDRQMPETMTIASMAVVEKPLAHGKGKGDSAGDLIGSVKFGNTTYAHLSTKALQAAASSASVFVQKREDVEVPVEVPALKPTAQILQLPRAA